jgi:tetratricopeptide (TPR) repeat protein
MQAIALGESAVKMAKDIGFPNLQLDVALNYGSVLKVHDKPHAIEHFQSVAKTAEELGNDMYSAAALNFLGEIYSELGQYENAKVYFEKSLDKSESCNSQFFTV